jgi:hypothetical protein
MAELPLALHPNEQAQQARYGNVAGALQVTALLAHRSVEDIQANREILCRPVPLSLIYRRYRKVTLKISFQETFMASSRFKEVLQNFDEEIG